ncbi:MAG: ribosome-binding factor A [Patescibacteria group bacterium]
MSSLRVEAGFHHLKDALAETFSKEVEFPFGVFVTVLEAKVTANTAHAKVVLSVMPDERHEEVLEALRQFDHEIKDGLAKRLRLRRIPRLHYVFDTTEARAAVIEQTINELKQAGEMSTILKAGAVILRDGLMEPEVLLVFRGGEHQDWSFPKGHCKKGEQAERTAVREIEEETGLIIRIMRRLPDLEYPNAEGRNVILAMYLAKPTENSPAERPEQEGDKVAWVPMSKVEATLTHENLKKYFRSLIPLLSKEG